eukprot:1274097-Pleurochrysis_carterae.AAC.1
MATKVDEDAGSWQRREDDDFMRHFAGAKVKLASVGVVHGHDGPHRKQRKPAATMALIQFVIIAALVCPAHAPSQLPTFAYCAGARAAPCGSQHSSTQSSAAEFGAAAATATAALAAAAAIRNLSGSDKAFIPLH